VKHFSAFLEQVLGTTCAVFLGAMLVVVFGQVLMRYVLRTPFPWGEELARFLEIWLTFMGASLAFLVGGHASIQMLRDRLPEKARRMTRVGIALLAGLFFLILVVKGMRLVLFTWSDQSPALSLPFGIVYLALPVASGIILLIQIRDIWQLFQPDGGRDRESG
jgi:TRAP-type C4-dicarboxylate transport system permease small subunit